MTHIRECEDCKQTKRVFVVTLVPDSVVDFAKRLGILGIVYTKHWLCTPCIAKRERARLRKYAVDHVSPYWGELMDRDPLAVVAFVLRFGGPEPLRVSDS